ncbi:MAG: hypothetical protein WCO09_00690 [bacterium]
MTNVAKTLNTIDRISATLFWSLLSTLVVLVGVYGYMVNQTVWNAFNKDQAEEQIVALNSKLGDLEFQYMSLSNNISIEKAYELGFQNAGGKTLFASREMVAKNVAMK